MTTNGTTRHAHADHADHAERFTIGARVDCTDGAGGKVCWVVIDPIARAVTHLVVEPRRRKGPKRLVPLDLLDPTTGGVRLRCTEAELEELPAAEETHFLGAHDDYADYVDGQALIWPYYGLGAGVAFGDGLHPVTRDTLPDGEIAVRRGDRVQALDGEIGRVQGIVVADPEHQVTHVLLQEGHLFGRKEVAIPIAEVTSVEHGIELGITKQQVEDLPSVSVNHPGE